MCKQFGITVVKGVTVLAVLLLFIASFILTIRCTVIYSRIKSYEQIFDSSMQSLPLYAVIFGTLLFLFTLFAFIGIWLNAFGMMCFFVIIVLILAAIAAVLGLIVVTETNYMLIDDTYFKHKMDAHKDIQKNPIKMESVNAMQSDLFCCGFETGVRYEFYSNAAPLPRSCCKNPTKSCIVEDSWDDDCIDSLKEYCIITHIEQGAMLIAIAGQALLTAAICYVFTMAVRQYYYY